jgi:hypothetical protein
MCQLIFKAKDSNIHLQYGCNYYSDQKKNMWMGPKRKTISQMPVAHACNPSYLGGWAQEDRGSKPALANSSQDPSSK